MLNEGKFKQFYYTENKNSNFNFLYFLLHSDQKANLKFKNIVLNFFKSFILFLNIIILIFKYKAQLIAD